MSQRNNPFSDTPLSNQKGNAIPKAYNVKLYDYLQQGNTINFVQARALGINQLSTHIAELREFTSIYSRTVRINAVKFLEYSLQPFIDG